MIRDASNLMARQILGQVRKKKTMLSLHVFRETLKEYPEDMDSYQEIVRIRRMSGDIGWLIQALETEVSYYDRQPLVGYRCEYAHTQAYS